MSRTKKENITTEVLNLLYVHSSHELSKGLLTQINHAFHEKNSNYIES